MKFTQREKAIMHEAFMVGRIYAASHEIETPEEIQEKLKERCGKAVRIMYAEYLQRLK